MSASYRPRLKSASVLVMVVLVGLVLVDRAAALSGETTRESVSTAGIHARSDSGISPGGRTLMIAAGGDAVTFASEEGSWDPDDRNASSDIFVRFNRTGVTALASVSSTGHIGSAGSDHPSISADGQIVAFDSGAPNLVNGRTRQGGDVYVHDFTTSTTERVSIGMGGAEPNGDSVRPSISADGRYVAFQSSASNLIPGDTNGRDDIFVYDRTAHTTTRVSVASDGTQGDERSEDPFISGDGSTIAFVSLSANLVPDDRNNTWDVFVHERAVAPGGGGVTTRASVSASGGDASTVGLPTLSADGRYVAFESSASNIVPGDTNNKVDVFVRDRLTESTTRVSVPSGGVGQANGESTQPWLSPDGRFVAFQSTATNLVPNDLNGASDIFVHDRTTLSTTIESVATDGTRGDGASQNPSLSTDARSVAFSSDATNLVAGDTNGVRDIFRREYTGSTTMIRTLTVAKAGTGTGTVTSDPPGINCGIDCAEGYQPGTVVTLTAAPAPGSMFAGFSGDADCTDGLVTMDAAKACTATFTTAPPPPSGGGAAPPTGGDQGTASATATITASATGAPTVGPTGTASDQPTGSGAITSGTRPPAGGGFGLFVFGGGTFEQLVNAACPGQRSTAVFFVIDPAAPDPRNPFVPFVSESTVAATNARWNELFPGGRIPAGTPVVARCI